MVTRTFQIRWLELDSLNPKSNFENEFVWHRSLFTVLELVYYISEDILQSGFSFRGSQSHPIMLRWRGIAAAVKRFRRLNRRKGHRKLRRNVRSCEFEDVHVMWEILNGKVEDPTSSPHLGPRDRLLCGFRTWVR
ncbi:hypothetical protein MLD38_024722 [Melastoma candidum]|uniref:Uncharacterized protein n=1 Tax=Melastoma candidum TaxID=119954 RepID=A0ACB9NT89_9MYRT|nr:hypothetical protein MLD38_024722 [Melastoma candidum]